MPRYVGIDLQQSSACGDFNSLLLTVCDETTTAFFHLRPWPQATSKCLGHGARILVDCVVSWHRTKAHDLKLDPSPCVCVGARVVTAVESLKRVHRVFRIPTRGPPSDSTIQAVTCDRARDIRESSGSIRMGPRSEAAKMCQLPVRPAHLCHSQALCVFNYRIPPNTCTPMQGGHDAAPYLVQNICSCPVQKLYTGPHTPKP